MPNVSCSMSTRKSSHASGWPSAVGSIQPSPKLLLDADLLLLDAAECSACGLPHTQMPNPDAVTSTLYSLHAGVFSSGVVKLDGGDGGGGALSLPGVRGDVPSSALEGVQPIGTVGRGSPQGVVVRLRRLPSVAAALGGAARGAFSAALVMRLSSLSKAGLSRFVGAGGARCLKRRRSGWYWSRGRAAVPGDLQCALARCSSSPKVVGAGARYYGRVRPLCFRAVDSDALIYPSPVTAANFRRETRLRA